MRPLFVFSFFMSLLFFFIDEQVGGAGMLVFGALWLVGGRLDTQVENVGPSVGSFMSTGCLLAAVGLLAIVALFVLGGGGEMVTR